MTKVLKISIILFAIIICASTISFASNINMDLSNNTADNTVYGMNTAGNADTTRATTSTNQSQLNPNSSSALSSSSLETSTIVNILLIVVGILLVLFAIAILIRLR